MPVQKSDVFLSHHSDDNRAVERLAKKLSDHGIKPWLDKWNLIPGQPWQAAIEKALAECCTCVVCLGPSGAGPWQVEEMRAAIDRRVRTADGSFRVVPVLLPGAKPTNGLPTFLAAATWVEFKKDIDDEEAFHCLLCGIRGLPPGEGIVPNQEQKLARVEVAIRISGTPEQFKVVADAAQELLRTASRDATLTITYVRSGSVVIIVECLDEGFDRLNSMFLSGQFTSLMGYVVEEIQLLPAATSVRDHTHQSSTQPKDSALGKYGQLASADQEVVRELNRLGKNQKIATTPPDSEQFIDHELSEEVPAFSALSATEQSTYLKECLRELSSEEFDMLLAYTEGKANEWGLARGLQPGSVKLRILRLRKRIEGRVVAAAKRSTKQNPSNRSQPLSETEKGTRLPESNQQVVRYLLKTMLQRYE